LSCCHWRKEQELTKALRVHRVGQIGASLLDERRLPKSRCFGPFLPLPTLMRVLDGHEQRVIVEPGRFLGAEPRELIAQLAAAPGLELLPRQVEQVILEVDDDADST